jgi:hypothetical protein
LSEERVKEEGRGRRRNRMEGERSEGGNEEMGEREWEIRGRGMERGE